MKTPLQLVYDTWVANGRCSSSALASALTAAGYSHTEASAATLLNKAILAHCSGQLRHTTTPINITEGSRTK